MKKLCLIFAMLFMGVIAAFAQPGDPCPNRASRTWSVDSYTSSVTSVGNQVFTLKASGNSVTTVFSIGVTNNGNSQIFVDNGGGSVKIVSGATKYLTFTYTAPGGCDPDGYSTATFSYSVDKVFNSSLNVTCFIQSATPGSVGSPSSFNFSVN